MSARLVSLDGHPDIVLNRTATLVGRHIHCDVRIDSARVSRRHCCLFSEGDHLVVRDLDSTNGTRVNGDRVAVARLAPGDELTIGPLRYRLESGPGPGPDLAPERLEDPPRLAPPGSGTFQIEIPPGDGRPGPVGRANAGARPDRPLSGPRTDGLIGT